MSGCGRDVGITKAAKRSEVVIGGMHAIEKEVGGEMMDGSRWAYVE